MVIWHRKSDHNPEALMRFVEFVVRLEIYWELVWEVCSFMVRLETEGSIKKIGCLIREIANSS